MKSLLPLCAMLALSTRLMAADSTDWISLFDGKTLDGWRTNENPQTFSVKNGELVALGDRSHLFYEGPVQSHVFKNFEFQADVLTKPGSNSGIYFHTTFQPEGWPAKGYEVQVNNTHKDPKKTGGLYGIKDNFTAPAKDDEWFTISIKVEGKHIVTRVNEKVVSDYIEEEHPQRPKSFAGRLLSEGTFAIQGHDTGSEVHYKNIRVRPLR